MRPKMVSSVAVSKQQPEIIALVYLQQPALHFLINPFAQQVRERRKQHLTLIRLYT